jgi:hypothetical protein
VQEGERLGEVEELTLLPPQPEKIPSPNFNGQFALNILKIVKIIETFAFRFCTLWEPSRLEED